MDKPNVKIIFSDDNKGRIILEEIIEFVYNLEDEDESNY